MFLFLSRLSFALPCWLFSVVTPCLQVWSVSQYPMPCPSLRRWTGLSEWPPRSRRTSWPSKGWRNTRTRRRRPSGLGRRRSPRRTGRTKEGSSSKTTRPDTGWIRWKLYYYYKCRFLKLKCSCSNAGAKKYNVYTHFDLWDIKVHISKSFLLHLKSLFVSERDLIWFWRKFLSKSKAAKRSE